MSAFNHEASRPDVFRDRADDSFEQITWSQRGLGTSQLIPGMIIGGGTTGDLIRSIPTRDNIVFAAGGKDTIVVNGLNNTVHGDDGTDTVVFWGPRSQDIVTPVTGGSSEVIVTRRGPASSRHVTTLLDVERNPFSDQAISTRRLRLPRSRFSG